MTAPPRGTDEYRWYQEGARDEARARKGGLSREVWDAMECVDALARLHPEEKPAELLRQVAHLIDGKAGTVEGLAFGQPSLYPAFPVTASTAYEHGHPAHLCTNDCPERVRIKIVIREGVSAHLIMAPLEMMPLAPGSYEAELEVDG